MIDWDAVEAEAMELFDAGHEPQALQVLRDALAADDDSELRHEIHLLAASMHESSHGFHKIEWHRLVLDTEAAPVR